MKLTPELIAELQGKMSLIRLAKTGLFQKLPFEQGDGDMSISRELRLHRAVLDKALVDLFSESLSLRKEIEQWLNIDNKDFTHACERAMLKPELVYMTFKNIKKILKGDNARFKKFKRSADENI